MRIPAEFCDVPKAVITHRKPILRLAAILACLTFAASTRAQGQQVPPATPALPTLTTAEQIRELTADQASRGYPVRLRAVITYIDPSNGDFFVQDSTAGIYISEPSPNLRFQPGDLLEIEGITESDFAPEITKARYRLLGQAPLPRPHQVHLDDLLSTREDSQWVQVEGIVQGVEPDRDRLKVDFVTEGRRLLVYVMGATGFDWNRLIDATVKVTGVCATLYNQNNQLVGVWVVVPTPQQVSVEEPPLADPFSAPLRPISRLMIFTGANASAHRVRVQGTVTLQRPRGVFIQDGAQGLYIPGLPNVPLQPGDRVEAVGFADIGDYTPFLLHALFRRIGSAPLPPPLLVTAQALQAGAYDTLRVRLDATLREMRTSEGGRTLVLEDGDTLFEARSADNRIYRTWSRLLPGSRLRLTGVCTVIVDSPESIIVLARPSWWTLRNTLVLLASLAGLTLAIGVWVVVLRRRVNAQTDVIRRRLESEAALEKRFQYVARAINDTIWDWDLVTQSVSWNSGIGTTFKYTSEKVGPGAAWRSERVHPEDRERVEQSLEAAIAGSGETWSAECRFLRGDGQYAYVLDRGYVMRDSSGRAVRMIGAMMDITARKQVERETQLAKEAAEAANRAKSEFVANMSHEIRTPMNGVLGMTDLLLGTELDSEQREYAGMVRTSAESLLTIINDVLNFSKIEAGKLELESIDFKLRGSIEPTLKTLALRAYQKGLELNCSIEPDVPDALLGDPSRLRQILVNLLGNSLKFTEKGEINLTVQRESGDEAVTALHFSVQDTGIGIPAEEQVRVFDAFTQADGSTTRRFGGTGLGLTISRQLVQMMGGRIWVDSVPGQGSTFHFTARFGISKSAGFPVTLDKTQLKGMRVLVVDDNLTNRRILEGLLAGWGMKPALAGDGREALGTLTWAMETHEPFRLVLTDASMPEVDGFQLAEEIRKDPQLSSTTILMLTSAGQSGDAARCRALGLEGYLTKPVSQSELLEAVLRVAGTKPPAAKPALVTRHSLREERKSLRILLAEDNPVNQLLTLRVLEKHGHTVITAGNGRAALERLENGDFDLILMDIQMPEMDGLEATAAIRKDEGPAGKRLPIIAMTAHAMDGDRERCLAAGMDGYISKPIRAEDLIDAIDKLGSSPAFVEVARAAKRREQEPIDIASAMERAGGNVELLKEMMALFLEELPMLMTTLREAVMAGDAKATERAAHKLKGCEGNFSAYPASEAATKLEVTGRDGSLSGAGPVLAKLEKEIARLKSAMADFSSLAARP
jgi:PAS domain S-box-containing protein